MRAEELDYALPEELIAQAPVAERDASRLLCVDRGHGVLEHNSVRALPDLLQPSLFVLNDTKVIPARLVGRKPTGGRVEFLLVERLDPGGKQEMQQRWLALARPSKRLRPGTRVAIDGGQLQVAVEGWHASGQAQLRLSADRPVDRALSECGRVPLPPYIRREPNPLDAERYQTVYARHDGAVAAPTAGLHLSKTLLGRLQECGHHLAQITLHVGPGTFAPVRGDRVDEHHMHSERYHVPQQTAESIRNAKAEGRQVVAVGTTVVRALESALGPQNQIRTGSSQTSLFIYPPYSFGVVDALLTNFHLPRSTLLALVMAFAGPDLTSRAYAAAVEAKYRFYSYGDAMLIHGHPVEPAAALQSDSASRTNCS